ncbi:hypothetical protein CGI92_14075 [Vibrio parahaemolyticus]|nr:hypothetical protein CGI92_14075 [Vibrio parahaemolyticus]
MVSLRERAQNMDMADLLDESGVEIIDGEIIKKIPKDFLYSIAQVRTEFNEEALKELADNIRENGQQAPIIVHPLDSTNRYCIHQGERRWRAICMLDDVETVDCLVRSNNTMFQQLSENIQRENLTPYEISEAIANLKEKESIKSIDVAKKLGKSKTWTSLYESISRMPEDLIQQLRSKNVLDVNTIGNIRQAAKINLEATLEYVSKSKVITRDGSERLKAKLNVSAKRSDEQKQIKFKPTSIVVTYNGADAFLMDGGFDVAQGTVDIYQNNSVINVPANMLNIVGYIKGS